MSHPVGRERSHEAGESRRADTVVGGALFGAIVFSGLFAGFLTGVLVLEASMRRVPAKAYVEVRQVELLHLDDLATVLLPAALLTTATLAVLTFVWRKSGRWPAILALTLLAVTLVLSAKVNVPINAEQIGWSALTPPADWADVRDRWQIAHLARTVTAVSAFLVLVAVAVTRRSERRGAAR